jgi:hypothetical protein
VHAGLPAEPEASTVHVPGVEPHTSQLPLQGELQQKPSTQLPVAHTRQATPPLQSLAVLHAVAWVFCTSHVPPDEQ